jgi:hypothetical protein
MSSWELPYGLLVGIEPGAKDRADLIARAEHEPRLVGDVDQGGERADYTCKVTLAQHGEPLDDNVIELDGAAGLEQLGQLRE